MAAFCSFGFSHHPSQHSRRFGCRCGVWSGGGGCAIRFISRRIALALGIGYRTSPKAWQYQCHYEAKVFQKEKRSCLGQLSGVVEPIAGVLGALAVLAMRPILPYALSFAAGAMIYVVVEELIPESQRDTNTDIATIGVMFGFSLMTFLDVALG